MVFFNYQDLESFVFDNKIKGPTLKQTALDAFKKEENKDRFSCIKCGTRLILANGPIRTKHFRHFSGEKEKECLNLKDDNDLIKNYCNESLAHKNFKAEFKKLIEKETIITIPAYYLSSNDYNNINEFEPIKLLDGSLNEFIKNEKKVIEERKVIILDVEEEVIQGNLKLNNRIKPDLEIICKDIKNGDIIRYNIEAVATHAVDEIKFNKIVKNKKNCIQVYLTFFKSFENFSEKNVSRYIYSNEINNEDYYIYLYKQYKNESENKNKDFIRKNDNIVFAYNNNSKTIMNKDEGNGICFNCGKELYYDKNDKKFRHLNTSDFLECSNYNNEKIMLLKCLKEDRRYKFNNTLFNLEIDKDFNIFISTALFKEKINPEQISLENLKNSINQGRNIKTDSLLELSSKYLNIIHNSNFILSKNKSDDFISKALLNKVCLFCEKDEKLHTSHCFMYEDTNLFKEQLDNKINKVKINLVKKLNNKTIEYLKTNSSNIKNIKDLFTDIGLNSESYNLDFIYDNEASNFHLSLFKDDLSFKVVNVKIFIEGINEYNEINNEDYPILKVICKINNCFEIIKIDEEIINLKSIINNNNVKNIIENILFKKINFISIINRDVRDIGFNSNFNLFENNILYTSKYSYFMRTKTSDNKDISLKIADVIFKEKNNKNITTGNKLLFYIDYWLDDAGKFNMSYSYDVNKIFTIAPVVFLLTNDLFLNKEILIEEEIFKPSKQKVLSIDETEIIYYMEIEGNGYNLCVNLHTVSFNEYSFYLDYGCLVEAKLQEVINFFKRKKYMEIKMGTFKKRKSEYIKQEIKNIKDAENRSMIKIEKKKN